MSPELLAWPVDVAMRSRKNALAFVFGLTPSACGAFAHVTPVWEMLLTRLGEFARVVITATRVLPTAGEAPMVIVNEATALAPVLPVALCTRANVATPVTIACCPTSLPARLALPPRVRLSPFTLLEIVRIAAGQRDRDDAAPRRN